MTKLACCIAQLTVLMTPVAGAQEAPRYTLVESFAAATERGEDGRVPVVGYVPRGTLLSGLIKASLISW